MASVGVGGADEWVVEVYPTPYTLQPTPYTLNEGSSKCAWSSPSSASLRLRFRVYRGTSPIRKRNPPFDPPTTLGWVLGGCIFLYARYPSRASGSSKFGTSKTVAVAEVCLVLPKQRVPAFAVE